MHPSASPGFALALVGAMTLAPCVGAHDATAQTAAGPRRSGLAGVVTDFGHRALLGAIVTVEGDTASAISDNRGQFRIRGLPAGARRFFVRRVGFEPVLFEVDLRPDAVVTVHARLQESAISIGTLVIEGQRHSLPLFREGFYERVARQSTGWFFPPDEILRRRITTVTSLLSDIPGITIERYNGASYAAGRATGLGPCPFNLWIDGALAGKGKQDLELLAPGALVRAVEVYPTAASVPARFVRGNSHCGALVIWTKGVVRELF